MKHRIAALAVAAVPFLAAASWGPLPDLIPMIVTSGGSTQVTIRLKNQGTAPSPAGVLSLSLGTPFSTVKTVAMPALAPGQINSVIIPIGQPLAGVNYVLRLDSNHAIAESNENNNNVSGKF
jgi:subtilase family serine protease